VAAPLAAGQTVRALLGGVDATNLGTVRLTVELAGAAPGAPRIDRVGVPVGPASGGTEVLIQGSGFAPGASVLFGGTPATDVLLWSERVLRTRTPPHASGPGAVSGAVPGAGTATLGNAFFYQPPESAGRAAPKPPRHPGPVRTVAPR
jgi:hypothetical protein